MSRLDKSGLVGMLQEVARVKKCRAIFAERSGGA